MCLEPYWIHQILKTTSEINSPTLKYNIDHLCPRSNDIQEICNFGGHLELGSHFEDLVGPYSLTVVKICLWLTCF